MTTLEEAIGETQGVLQPLFAKPKLTNKLLTKPPFRFIHDIVTATLRQTGFPDGLYSSEELDSGNVKDKASKMAFLEKLIRLVSICQKRSFSVRASKVVAGHEPLNTNRLLVAFGRSATDANLDRYAISNCLSDKSLKELLVDNSSGAKNKKSDAKRKEEERKQLLADSSHDSKKIDPSVADDTDDAKADAQPKGNHDVKLKLSQFSAKHSGTSVNMVGEAHQKTIDLASQIQMCNMDIVRTREVVHQIVAKPKCSEKLLSKPPFRFLHDLIMAVGKATGFGLETVFSEREMDSSNVTEKASKLIFLGKIISHVQTTLGGIEIDVIPRKIVAGLEPEKTCRFLQLLVVAATIENDRDSNRQMQGHVGAPKSNTPSSDGERKFRSEAAAASSEIPEEKHVQGHIVVSSTVSHEPGEDKHAEEENVQNGSKKNGEHAHATHDKGDSIIPDEGQSLEERISACNTDPTRTRQVVAEIVAKPKCTDKLLGKPPFRFLHDLIMVVGNATGFSLEVFSEREMDSSNVTDKASKIIFLEKIINHVQTNLGGIEIDVKPRKVVAGLEPEKTCRFLQLLTVAATKGVCNLNKREASEQRKQEYIDPEIEGREDLDEGDTNNVNEEKHVSASKVVHGAEDIAESSETKDILFKGIPAASTNTTVEEKSDEALKGFLTDSTNALGVEKDEGTLTTPTNSNDSPRSLGSLQEGPKHNESAVVHGSLRERVTACNGDSVRTRSMIEEIVEKPRCTDKLLSKPPFRFLHDIIMAVGNETGYGVGIYSNEVTDSSNVTDKASKIMFLEKIINHVQTTLDGIKIDVNPKKTVAGLEPEKTCQFLQLLTVAATVPSRKLEEIKSINYPTVSSSAPAEESQQTQQMKASFDPLLVVEDDTGRTGRAGKEPPQHTHVLHGAGAKPLSMRPTTARHRPPRVRDATTKSSLATEDARESVPMTAILKDGDDFQSSTLVNKNAAIINAHRGSFAEEQETKQTCSRDLLDESHSAIVQKIVQEQSETAPEEMKDEKKEEEGGLRLRLNIKKTGTASTSSFAAQPADLEVLMHQVQRLVQSTAPLGKCMDYIRDDLGKMHKERQHWTSQYQRTLVETTAASERTAELLAPLKKTLVDIDEEIEDVQKLTQQTKCTVMQNERRIKKLLHSSATK